MLNPNRTVAAPSTKTSRNAGQVEALARGLEILRCFSPARPYLGTTAIARLTGLPQPTVWRLCQTLLNYGFLLQGPRNQSLQLGTSALALGVAASGTFDALDHVRPLMEQLADRNQVAVSIANREGLEVVYLNRYAAEAMVGTNLRVGSRVPLHKCTLGWAMLAAMSPEAFEELVQEIIDHYPKQSELIRTQAENIRMRYDEFGYVMAEGLFHKHILALAIPICDSNGPQLAINCSSSSASMSEEKLHNDIAPVLRDIADILETSLFTSVLP